MVPILIPFSPRPQLQFSKFRLLAHIDEAGVITTYSKFVEDEALLPAYEMDAWVTLARMGVCPGMYYPGQSLSIPPG